MAAARGRLSRLLSTAAATAAQDSGSLAREWGPTSKRVGLIGRKCGMLSAWDKWGRMRPVTVVEVQDNVVVQAKTADKEGYYGLQVGAGWQKEKRLSYAARRHFLARGLDLKRDLAEFRVSPDALLPIGTRLLARHFVPGQLVDVQGTSRGKGFAGVMKRHGFKGGNASHGATKTHRAPGAIGGGTNSNSGGKVVKGKKMPGNMGNKTRTVHNLVVYKVDVPRNLLFLVGSVPGGSGDIVKVRDAVRGVGLPGGARPPFPTFIGDRQGDEGEDAGHELVMDFGDTDPYRVKAA